MATDGFTAPRFASSVGAVSLLSVVAALFLFGACSESPSPIHAANAETTRLGRVVVISVGACNSTTDVAITSETNGAVRFLIEARESDDLCSDNVTLCLDEPLGDRTLIDDVDEAPVEVEFVEDLSLPFDPPCLTTVLGE